MGIGGWLLRRFQAIFSKKKDLPTRYNLLCGLNIFVYHGIDVNYEMRVFNLNTGYQIDPPNITRRI